MEMFNVVDAGRAILDINKLEDGFNLFREKFGYYPDTLYILPNMTDLLKEEISFCRAENRLVFRTCRIVPTMDIMEETIRKQYSVTMTTISISIFANVEKDGKPRLNPATLSGFPI